MRQFLRPQIPVVNLENGYRKMLFMMGGVGLGIGFSFLPSYVASCEAPSKKSAEKIWLSENKGGAFVSYTDMAGATADQLYYRHNRSGTFVPDHDFRKNFNAFLLCLIALELRNGSEFQYRLLRLQEKTDKAFLKDANAFLAAAAFDMARARPLHMVEQREPEMVRALKESDRVYGQSASVPGASVNNRHLLMSEFNKCQEKPPRLDFDPVFCRTVESWAGNPVL